MKKFGKILSSVLAASMLISCFAMNAMAASKAHTVTIVPGAVTEDGLLPVEVKMDNTEALVSCGYSLTYDATAFTADNTKVNRLEKCIDKTWLDDIKNSDGDWAYYLGNPTYNVKTAGTIKFSWAGTEGVEADYAVDNRVIGKFYLNVADTAAGEYTFSLTGTTMDAGENSTADMVCAPVTVTVGSKGADNYFTANFIAGGEKYNANKGMTFNFFSKKANDSASYTWNFTEMFDEVVFEAETEVDVQIKVENAPAEDDLTITGFEWSATGRE